MALHPDLLSILVCPQDHGALIDVDGELLYNPRLRCAYPVRDGVPMLLVDEARTVDDDEHGRILAR